MSVEEICLSMLVSGPPADDVMVFLFMIESTFGPMGEV